MNIEMSLPTQTMARTERFLGWKIFIGNKPMRLDVHQAEMARIAVRAQHIRGEKSVDAINDRIAHTIVRVEALHIDSAISISRTY
jgi:hypothetical protein